MRTGRLLLISAVVVVLAMLLSWILWTGVQPVRAETLPNNTIHLDSGSCVMLETGYVRSHPDRHDLKVKGTDCTITREMVVTPSPAIRVGSGRGLATATFYCSDYTEYTHLNAWGRIQVGYTSNYIGVCHNGVTAYVRYGPSCHVYFWPPNMKGWAHTCNYYGSGTSRVTYYASYDTQLWEVFIGWCCDRWYWAQYSVGANGTWWWN